MTYLLRLWHHGHIGYAMGGATVLLVLVFILYLHREARRHHRTLDPHRDLWVATRAEEEDATLWERVKDGLKIERTVT